MRGGGKREVNCIGRREKEANKLLNWQKARERRERENRKALAQKLWGACLPVFSLLPLQKAQFREVKGFFGITTHNHHLRMHTRKKMESEI